MAYSTLHPLRQLRFTPARRSATLRRGSAAPPRSRLGATHTRQQTLTQIDFVFRSPRYEEVGTDSEDEWSPPPKRRRKTSTARESDETSVPTPAYETTFDKPEATPSRDARLSPNTAGVSAGRGRRTPPPVQVLEIPSSRSPSGRQSHIKIEASPSKTDLSLLEKSPNVPSLPSSNKKRSDGSRVQPKLEVKDTYGEENNIGQFSQDDSPSRYPGSTAKTSARLVRSGVQEVISGDDNARTTAHKEGEKRGNVGRLGTPTGDVGRSTVKFSSKTEIQDSETELSDEEIDMEPSDDDTRRKDERVVNESDAESDDGSLQEESDGSQYAYDIGPETQAVVDPIDLSSDHRRLCSQTETNPSCVVDTSLGSQLKTNPGSPGFADDDALSPASVTMSQLLPDSLMDSYLPPPPPLTQESATE